MKNRVPTYCDGFFELYRMTEDDSEDFPKVELEDTNMTIFFREISVFDRLRFELSQGGKQVTMKIRIPQYKGVDSNCYCKIDGVFHQVYNAAHIMTDGRYPETELTLIATEKKMEVLT